MGNTTIQAQEAGIMLILPRADVVPDTEHLRVPDMCC